MSKKKKRQSTFKENFDEVKKEKKKKRHAKRKFRKEQNQERKELWVALKTLRGRGIKKDLVKEFSEEIQTEALRELYKSYIRTRMAALNAGPLGQVAKLFRNDDN